MVLTNKRLAPGVLPNEVDLGDRTQFHRMIVNGKELCMACSKHSKDPRSSQSWRGSHLTFIFGRSPSPGRKDPVHLPDNVYSISHPTPYWMSTRSVILVTNPLCVRPFFVPFFDAAHATFGRTE